MSDSNNPYVQNKSSQWGSPDSWDKNPADLKQSIKSEKARSRLQQQQLKNSWGKPNAWNSQQSSSINLSQNNNKHWGNPFGWPLSLSNPQNSQNQPQQAKVQSGFVSSNPGQNAWGSYQYQGWSGQNKNSYQNVQNSSPPGWGFLKPNSNQNEESKLKGDQFCQFLKQKDIDDEIICILATQGINSLEILRMCSQQALAVKGIKLSDVIKLKNI